MTLATHARETNTAATQLAIAAQDLRDRSVQGIHPSHEEIVKLLQMAKGLAYHAARTLYAANCVDQRKPALVAVIEHQPSEDTEGGAL